MSLYWWNFQNWFEPCGASLPSGEGGGEGGLLIGS